MDVYLINLRPPWLSSFEKLAHRENRVSFSSITLGSAVKFVLQHIYISSLRSLFHVSWMCMYQRTSTCMWDCTTLSRELRQSKTTTTCEFASKLIKDLQCETFNAKYLRCSQKTACICFILFEAKHPLHVHTIVVFMVTDASYYLQKYTYIWAGGPYIYVIFSQSTICAWRTK